MHLAPSTSNSHTQRSHATSYHDAHTSRPRAAAGGRPRPDRGHHGRDRALHQPRRRGAVVDRPQGGAGQGRAAEDRRHQHGLHHRQRRGPAGLAGQLHSGGQQDDDPARAQVRPAERLLAESPAQARRQARDPAPAQRVQRCAGGEVPVPHGHGVPGQQLVRGHLHDAARHNNGEGCHGGGGAGQLQWPCTDFHLPTHTDRMVASSPLPISVPTPARHSPMDRST